MSSPSQTQSLPAIGVYHHPAHGAWQLVLRGRHEPVAGSALRTVVDGLGPGSRVVVDLSEATVVDPTVLSTLCRAARRARRSGGRLLLVAPADGPAVADGLPQALKPYDSVDSALAALAAPVAQGRRAERSAPFALLTSLLGH